MNSDRANAASLSTRAVRLKTYPLLLKATPDRLAEESVMCNDYQQHVTRELLLDVAEKQDLGLTLAGDHAPWQQSDDVRAGELGPVLRAAGNGTELTSMVFGFPHPSGGRPIINITSDFVKEGERTIRDYTHSKRCVIIASAFYEFKGARYPKAKYQFTLNGSPVMGIAGLWRDSLDGRDDAFAMLTTLPGADIEPIHERQIVILRPDQFGAWLSYAPHVNDLLQPLPVGSLSVEMVRAEAPPKRKKAA